MLKDVKVVTRASKKRKAKSQPHVFLTLFQLFGEIFIIQYDSPKLVHLRIYDIYINNQKFDWIRIFSISRYTKKN